jgi:hypothetical protein
MRPNGVTTWSFRAQHACWRYSGKVLRNKSGLTQHQHSKHGFSLPLRQRRLHRSPTPRSPTPPSQHSPSPPSSQQQQRSPTPPGQSHSPTPESSANGKSIVDYHPDLNSESPLLAHLTLIYFCSCKASISTRRASVSMAIVHPDNQTTGIRTKTASSSKQLIFYSVRSSCPLPTSTQLCSYGLSPPMVLHLQRCSRTTGTCTMPSMRPLSEIYHGVASLCNMMGKDLLTRMTSLNG